jgi:hypothetical protein
MYIGMTKKLNGCFNIIHVAYSAREENLLKMANITDNVINFSSTIEIMFKKERLNYELLAEIDGFFIKYTGGRFTLNGSIQSDRGFTILSYDQVLLMAQIYYKFWKNIFENYKIDYVKHEAPSLLFNHICALMCRKYNAMYIYTITLPGEDHISSYLMLTDDLYHSVEIDKYYNKYITNQTLIDVSRCQNFIGNFRSDIKIFSEKYRKKNATYFNLIIESLKDFFRKIRHQRQFNPQVNNIDYWLTTQQLNMKRMHNLITYKKQIKFNELDCSQKYYYYSLHLEPEATVLYLADGIYKNQIKLIENIAAQLPVGTYLYVKDHPHELGYRSTEDYEKLQLVPNIRLLRQSIPGKEVIKNAIGVFTLNGSAGFESLLMNKQVYTFGSSYYNVCKRVNYIKNIKDLREIVYRNKDIKYSDDTELYAFVNAYLSSIKIGVVDYFLGQAKEYGIDLGKNENQLAEDFIEFSKYY